MSIPKITKENNCIYLTQDIKGLGVYEKAKAIVNFCEKETKELEKEIDKAILDIFERNGINIPNKSKSALKTAFAWLNSKNVDIQVNDIYKNLVDLYNSELIYENKYFTIWLEDGTYLQAGIEIKEIMKI